MAIFMTGQPVVAQLAGWQPATVGQTSGLRIAVTTRGDGNMSYRYGSEQEVRQNREQVFKRLGLSVNRVVPLSLNSTDGVHWLEDPSAWTGVSRPGFASEGVWCPSRATALFLMVADCCPMAFSDPATGALGVLHAGRAEIASGFLERFLELGQEHGVDLRRLYVFVGPGICVAHYAFDTLPDGHVGTVVEDAAGMFHVDLRDDIRRALRQAGIRDENVTEDPRCTYESNDLYSHRRDRDTGEGRFALIASRHA